MTEQERNDVLNEVAKIGGITSALANGRPVFEWAQRIQRSLDEIARIVGEAADYRGRR